MPPQPVSPVVLAFMADHIRSLEELQLLMAVIQSPDRWWDAAAATRELGITTTSARRALDHLAAHNLLDIRITGDVRYQYRPGTDDLRAAARATEEAYRSNPLALAQLVTGTARRGIRDFADAFRIRRDDDR
jgi:hypothetical protein